MKNRISNLSIHEGLFQSSHQIYLFLIRSVFILLFAYSGAIKFASFAVFKIQLHRQPFPEEISNILIWAIPIAELLVAALLVLPNTWKKGILISFGLMTSFTIYTALATTGTFGYVPCACGGFIQGFSWFQHLLFNTGLTALAGVALSILNRSTKVNLFIKEYEQKSK